ncbi:MvdC/MvdD family ATP grasp protein [Streptomyces sp. NPDC055036]
MTSRDDVTADLVVGNLTKRRLPVHRIDPADLPDKLRVTGAVEDGLARILIEDEHRSTSTMDIKAIYWRKPATPLLKDAGSHLTPAVRAWIADESKASLFGILRTLDVVWVNHPDKNAVAHHKAPQLLAAHKHGFDVPETIFTNVAARAETFVEKHRQAIVKTLTQRDMEFVPARLVEPGEDLSGVGAAMHMFQRYIPKVADVRVTVVGERLFAAQITGGGVDWRSAGENATYEPVSVPRGVVQPINRFMTHYGLAYGAFDFAVSKSGPWFFLECNPNGQFGFVEAKTGMAISQAIADYLVQMPESLMHREGLSYGHQQSSVPR